jgi:hypothetical protein
MSSESETEATPAISKTISKIFSAHFSGVLDAIKSTDNWAAADKEEIEDDFEGEKEAMDLQEGLSGAPRREPEEVLAEIKQHLQEVSKGVKDATDMEYKRYVRPISCRKGDWLIIYWARLMVKCQAFLEEQGLIAKGEVFFSTTPSQEAPYCITAWIMHSCDETNIDGTPKPSGQFRDSYSHAMKMRAAATYAFGHIHSLGSLPWHKSELTGNMSGNPSVSTIVSSYMVSLRRRKVQNGEVAMSARAITPVRKL